MSIPASDRSATGRKHEEHRTNIRQPVVFKLVSDPFTAVLLCPARSNLIGDLHQSTDIRAVVPAARSCLRKKRPSRESPE